MTELKYGGCFWRKGAGFFFVFCFCLGGGVVAVFVWYCDLFFFVTNYTKVTLTVERCETLFVERRVHTPNMQVFVAGAQLVFQLFV